MDIRNRKELHSAAAHLSGHPGGKRTALIYVGISCAMSLVLMLLDLLLSHQIDATGGLSGMGLRSILTTAQTVLPLAQMVVMLCLGLGYKVAMVDLMRHQSTDPRTLKEGFRRFGPLLRLNISLSLIYAGLAITALYLSSYLFVLLPFSNSFLELAEPMISSMTIMDATFTLDDATALAMGQAMIPMLVIFAVLFLALFLPMFYRNRMSTFCLCEDPVPGAFAAMRSSRAMLRRNCFALFRVDLSLWWFYLLETLATAIPTAGSLLVLMGISLPWAVTYFVFPILSLAAQFVLYYLFLNRVTLTYAAAYEALRPKPQPASGGMALGNIFDLYRESNEYRGS